MSDMTSHHGPNASDWDTRSAHAPEVATDTAPEVDHTSQAPEVLESPDQGQQVDRQYFQRFMALDKIDQPDISKVPDSSVASQKGLIGSLFSVDQSWVDFHRKARAVVESFNGFTEWARNQTEASDADVVAAWDRHRCIETSFEFRMKAHDFPVGDDTTSGDTLSIPLVARLRTHVEDPFKTMHDAVTYARFVSTFDQNKEPTQEEMIEKARMLDTHPDIQSDYWESFPSVFTNTPRQKRRLFGGK